MEWSKIDRLSQVESACILFQGWYFSPSVWDNWVHILEEQYDVVLFWDIYNPPSDDVWCHLRSLVGLVDLYAWSVGGMFAIDLASKYPGFINELITFNSFPCFSAKKDWPGSPKGSFNNLLKNLSSPEGMRKNFLLPVVLGGNNNKKELAHLDKHIHNADDLEGHARLLDKLFTLDYLDAWRNIACKQMHFFSESDNIVPKGIYDAWQKIPNIISSDNMEFVQEDASIKWISISGHSHASFLLDPQIYVKVLEKECDSEDIGGEFLIFMDNFIISSRIQFSKYAKSYDKYAKFQHDIGQDLLFKLESYLYNNKLNINNILDLGSGTGSNFDKLLDITKANKILELDHSQDMLKISKQKKLSNYKLFCCADMHDLPLSSDFKFDLVFSNLAMQWCLNLDKLLLEISNLLSKNGVIVFSNVLSGSLGEISKSSAINNFLTKDEILNKLSNINNISLYDFKYKKITRKFDSLFELFASVKKIGAAHVMADIKERFSQGLMTPRRMAKLELTWPKDIFGRFELSYNIGYFIYEKK